MIYVSGWFESDCGAVQFEASGENVDAAALQMVKRFGDDAVGVDREAEVDSLVPDAVGIVLSGEYRFWRSYDRQVAMRLEA